MIAEATEATGMILSIVHTLKSELVFLQPSLPFSISVRLKL